MSTPQGSTSRQPLDAGGVDSGNGADSGRLPEAEPLMDGAVESSAASSGSISPRSNVPGDRSSREIRATVGSSQGIPLPPMVAEGDRTIISKVPTDASHTSHRFLAPNEMGKLLEGQRLGHFELLEFVGGGGMGAVFRAHDTMLDRIVAVKVLSQDQSTDEETLRRFKNEAQSAARLDHGNIGRVYYVGEDRTWHYIVFEFIDGINLRDLVDRDGPLSLIDAVSYMLQITDALGHAARREVVHRDIKPSNVLITPDKKAKLVDMGLARLHQVEHTHDLTASGVTLGTFDYISPEQARDPRSADVRSDMYSLGCTFFFVLTGRPPFPDGTVLQKLLQHQGEEPPDPRQLRPDLTDSIVRVLRKLLAKVPEKRYQLPDDLARELAAIGGEIGLPQPGELTGVTLTSPSDAAWAAVRRHLPWAVPMALLLVVVALLQIFGSSADESVVLPKIEQVDSATGRAVTSTSQTPASSVHNVRSIPTSSNRAKSESATSLATDANTKSAADGKVTDTGTAQQPTAQKSSTSSSPAATKTIDSSASGDNSTAEGTAADASVGPTPISKMLHDKLEKIGLLPSAQSTAPPTGSSAGKSTTSPSPLTQETKSNSLGGTPDGSKTTDKIPATSLTRQVATTAEKTSAPKSTGASPSTSDKTKDVIDTPEARVATATKLPVSPASPSMASPSALDAKASSTGGTAAGAVASNTKTLTVTGRGATGTGTYDSLEAAIRAASAGDVIELAFNGALDQQPINFYNLQLTIRGRRGYHPILRFQPAEQTGVSSNQAMIVVAGGQLQLSDLQIELNVPKLPAESWALFRMEQPRLLKLQNCWLTIRNAKDALTAYHSDVACFDVSAGAAGGVSLMGEREAFIATDLQLENTVIRGETVLLRDRALQPINLQWSNGLLAVSEVAVLASSGTAASRDGSPIAIALNHVTVVAQRGLCRVEEQADARFWPQIGFNLVDCVVRVSAPAAMIELRNTTEQGIESRVAWQGDHNFYEGFSTFWRYNDTSTKLREMSLADWVKHWGSSSVAPRWNSSGWLQLPNVTRERNTHLPEDYALRAGANDALHGASDGRAPGVVAALIPPHFESSPAADSATTKPSPTGSTSSGASTKSPGK